MNGRRSVEQRVQGSFCASIKDMNRSASLNCVVCREREMMRANERQEKMLSKGKGVQVAGPPDDLDLEWSRLLEVGHRLQVARNKGSPVKTTTCLSVHDKGGMHVRVGSGSHSSWSPVFHKIQT
eukprot:scaffold230317_cov19-Tisochrysis_lutea.AAC.1